MPEWAEEFSQFLLLTGQQHADVRTKCTLIKKWCKKKFLQRQVKTVIRKSSSWGDFLKTLEQMYQVYETDLSVRTEIEELSPLPEFPTAARISEFVAQLEELMGRMNPSSYGPTEPHLWLMGKIPPRTWENCKETSERKSLSGRDDTVVVDTTGWRGEHQARGAEEKYMREAPEAPVLTQERLRSLEGRDPMAAALLSVVSSLPPSEDAPDPEAQAAMEKVATAKVKAWRKAGKQEKEKEPMKAYPMFGTTWGEGFEAPYGEISVTTSNDSSEW